MRRVSQKHILLAVILIGLAFRIFLIDRQSLWADELFSLAMATGHSLEHPAAAADPSRGDFVEGEGSRSAATWKEYLEPDPHTGGLMSVVRAVQLSDTNPPFYYILLHFWTRVFGTSGWALKSLSVLFSLAAILLLVRLSRRFGGEETAITACILFALAPAALYYSTEGRMYSLLWLATLAAAEASLGWREGRTPIRSALFWVTSSAVGLWTHYFFVFVWVTFLFWLLLYPGRIRYRHLAVTAGIVVGLAAPWYVGAGAQISAWHVTSGWLERKPPDWNWVFSAWTGLFGHLSGCGIWGGGWRANTVAILLFSATAGTFVWCWRRRVLNGKRGLLWMWLVVPLACIVFLDIWNGTYALANYRYMTAGLPAAMLITATALSRWPKRIRWITLATIVVLWLPAMRDLVKNEARVWSPFREIAQHLSQNVEPNDVVIVHSIPSGVLSFAYYASPDLEIAAWVEQLGQRREEDLDRIMQCKRRVYLVRAHEVWADASVEDWLRRSTQFISESRRGGTVTTEFEVPVELSQLSKDQPDGLIRP